jgi:hypothetical protein
MKHPITPGLAVLVSSLTIQGAEPKTGPNIPAADKTNPAGQWRSEPPADCPFKPSKNQVTHNLYLDARAHPEYAYSHGPDRPRHRPRFSSPRDPARSKTQGGVI